MRLHGSAVLSECQRRRAGSSPQGSLTLLAAAPLTPLQRVSLR